MSMMRKIQAGLFRKPITKRIPPKNSVDLHNQALNRGKGMFAVCSVFAKSSMEAICKTDKPYLMNIIPHQILSKQMIFFDIADPLKIILFHPSLISNAKVNDVCFLK